MNKMTKMTLAAVFTAALATSAQAQYVNGDLLVGFTANSAGGTDLIENLGLASALTTGETWSIATTGETAFGVIGGSADGSTYLTTYRSASYSGKGAIGAGVTLTGIAGTQAQQLGLGGAGTSVSVSGGNTYSWFNYESQPAVTGNFWGPNSGYNPDASSLSGKAYLFSVDNSGNPTSDSYFTYNATTDVLTFNGPNTLGGSVPEPTTYGLLAGLGLLALSVRRQFAKA